MRFLHTADWHLGKGSKGRSRLDEQEAVLAEILDIARRQQIECLLFAGDLFEHLNPSAEAERLAYNFFAELAGLQIPAVVIGGNHDNPRRLGALTRLTEKLRLWVRPDAVSPEQGGIIEVTSAKEKAVVGVLPWVWSNRVTPADEALRSHEDLIANYAARMTQMFERLGSFFQPANINILLSHVYIFDCLLSPGAERAVATAQGYAVPRDALPSNAQYIGLGHLHRPQDVAAAAKAAYCGSPLQLDFGEHGQDKRVVIVDVKARKQAKIESVALSAGRRLRTVSGSLDQLRDQAESMGTDLLKVRVRIAEPRLGVADEVRDILPNTTEVFVEVPSRPPIIEIRTDASEETADRLFARYHVEREGTEPPEELMAAFRILQEEAGGASQ